MATDYMRINSGGILNSCRKGCMLEEAILDCVYFGECLVL